MGTHRRTGVRHLIPSHIRKQTVPIVCVFDLESSTRPSWQYHSPDARRERLIAEYLMTLQR
jgi:hypothetical protein